MPGSSVGQLSSQRAISYIFFCWLLVVFSLLALAGHHPGESFGAAAMVAVQFTAGFVWWQFLSKGSTREIVGAAAMGAVLGSILSALFGILFVSTPLAQFAWFLPSLGAPVIASRVQPISRPSTSILFWLLAASLLGLATEWTWLLPTAIGSVIISSAQLKRRVVVMLPVLGLLIIQLWVLTVRSPYWSQFRQGLTEVADYVYLEAIARGAMQWAHRDNILTSGTDLGYHWLSFAWAGRITDFVGSTGMAFSSHLVQVTFVFAVVSLTFAVTRHLGGSESLSILASLTTAILVGFPYGVMQALTVLSPSQPFAIAAVLAMFLHLVTRSPDSNWRTFMLLALLMIGVIGGKVSAIPAAIAGLMVYGLFLFKQSRKVLSLTFLMISATMTILSFFYFCGGAVVDGTTGTLQLSLFEVAYTEGPLAGEGRPILLTLVGVAAMLAGILSLVPGVLLSGRSLNQFSSPLALMLVIGGTVSFLVGFVYVGERAGIFYFFNLGVALLIPISSVSLSRTPADLDWRLISIIVLAATAIGVLIQNLHVLVSSSGIYPSLLRSLLLLSPLLAGVCVLALLSRDRRFLSAIVVLVISLSSFVAWVPRFSWVQLRNGMTYQPNTDSVSGSPQIREALLWLRRNSSVDEIVVTNRFCNQHDQSLPECPAYLTVVSSVIGRRMYVENIEWSARSATGVLDRALQSIEFVDTPSDKSAEFLTTANVSWVFVDRSVTTTTSWEPWAEVVFENDDSFILRVLATTGMP